MLIGLRAHVAAIREDGWTALHVATENGHAEIVQATARYAIRELTDGRCRCLLPTGRM